MRYVQEHLFRCGGLLRESGVVSFGRGFDLNQGAQRAVRNNGFGAQTSVQGSPACTCLGFPQNYTAASAHPSPTVNFGGQMLVRGQR